MQIIYYRKEYMYEKEGSGKYYCHYLLLRLFVVNIYQYIVDFAKDCQYKSKQHIEILKTKTEVLK